MKARVASASRCSSRGARAAPTDRFSSSLTVVLDLDGRRAAGPGPAPHASPPTSPRRATSSSTRTHSSIGAVGRAVALGLLTGRRPSTSRQVDDGPRAALLEPAGAPPGQPAPRRGIAGQRPGPSGRRRAERRTRRGATADRGRLAGRPPPAGSDAGREVDRLVDAATAARARLAGPAGDRVRADAGRCRDCDGDAPDRRSSGPGGSSATTSAGAGAAAGADRGRGPSRTADRRAGRRAE